MKKNQIKWVSIGMILIIIISAIVSGCSTSTTGQITKNTDPIKIGFSTPLTGNGAEWGVEFKNGAELAYDEIKDLTIDGRKIEIIYEDSQCDPKIAVSITQKLINVDKAKILTGTACSSNALAIAPIVESNKIILLGTGVSNPDISYAGDYVFRIWPSDAYRGQSIAEYMIKKGVKTTAIIYIQNDLGQGLEKVFTKTFKENNGEVLLSEGYAPESRDFRTILTKIKNSGADAIYVISYPEESPMLFKQLREIGIEQNIYAYGDVFLAEGIMEKLGNSVEGVIYNLNMMPVNDYFKLLYNNKFQKEGGILAALGYDSIKVLVEAVEICNGDNPTCIKKALYEMDYQGATGDIIFDENGDVTKGTEFYKIVSGEAVKI